MIERTSTTEPVRRRIGDGDSRGFAPPPSQPTGGDEQPTSAEQPTGTETAPAPGRRQIIAGANLRRDPNQIHANDASGRAGSVAEPGPGPGRRSIGGRRTTDPATAGPKSSVADLDEPVVDDSAVADAATAKQRWRPRARLTRTTVLVGTVIVVLLAATIFFGLKWRSQDNLDGLRTSALSTGKTDGVLLSSYDYRNLTGPGSSFAKVLRNATPAFRKNFLSTSSTLDKLLTQYNATATGTVISAGVASFSSSRAVVLLFIDQTVNNTVQKSASATQPLRTQLILLHQNGQWLIDDLQVPK